MKPLPLACFAAALFLVGIGILHHDQVKTRNAAARQVHEQKMEKHWQQVTKARHDEVDRQLAEQEIAAKIAATKREVESGVEALNQINDVLNAAAREEQARKWRREAYLTELELRAAQEAADKARGF